MNSSEPHPVETPAPRILLVEDEAMVRNVEAVLLRRNGYDVDIAVDGQAGWDALNASNYDLLITDQQMPRLSGMELIWRLHAAGSALPVIMTSGLTCPEVIRPATDPGLWFDAFIQKPFGPGELINTVKHVLAAPLARTTGQITQA